MFPRPTVLARFADKITVVKTPAALSRTHHGCASHTERNLLTGTISAPRG